MMGLGFGGLGSEEGSQGLRVMPLGFRGLGFTGGGRAVRAL